MPLDRSASAGRTVMYVHILMHVHSMSVSARRGARGRTHRRGSESWPGTRIVRVTPGRRIEFRQPRLPGPGHRLGRPRNPSIQLRNRDPAGKCRMTGALCTGTQHAHSPTRLSRRDRRLRTVSPFQVESVKRPGTRHAAIKVRSETHVYAAPSRYQLEGE